MKTSDMSHSAAYAEGYRDGMAQAVADARRYRALRDSGRYSPSNFGPGWALCTGYDKDRHSPERRRELDASDDLQIQEAMRQGAQQ
jgi:hypothetical protein